MTTKVFADCDIVLDVLAGRNPFYGAAAALFSLADKRELEICVSALSFSNIHYILCREMPVSRSRRYLAKLKILVTVLPVTEKTIESALFSEFKDFEDGIQYFTAVENDAKLILTRNLKDYKSAEIPVMTAEQFIRLHK
jgi:hypothetical protein